MCTRYISATDREIEAVWKIDRRNTESWPRQLFPRSRGPFIRRAKDALGYERELVVGQWARHLLSLDRCGSSRATVLARSSCFEVLRKSP